jgi:hypothetical protein
MQSEKKDFRMLHRLEIFDNNSPFDATLGAKKAAYQNGGSQFDRASISRQNA